MRTIAVLRCVCCLLVGSMLLAGHWHKESTWMPMASCLGNGVNMCCRSCFEPRTTQAAADIMANANVDNCHAQARIDSL